MKKLFFLFGALSLALAACGGKSAATPTPALVISEPGKTIEVNAGDQFKIMIQSNPSTGYHWEVVGSLDETLVKFVSKEYRANQPVMPGSSGVDVWTFQAVAAGQATITLGYYPPSNTPVDPAQTEVFTIQVK